METENQDFRPLKGEAPSSDEVITVKGEEIDEETIKEGSSNKDSSKKDKVSSPSKKKGKKEKSSGTGSKNKSKSSKKGKKKDIPPPYQNNYQKQQDQPYKRVFNGEYGSYNRYPHLENDNLFAGAGYIATLLVSMGWIVPLLVLLLKKPQSPWLRFHSIQALSLVIIATVVQTVMWVIVAFLMYILIGFICLPFAILISTGFQVYLIVMAILCFLDKDHSIPVLGNWIERSFV